MLERTRWVCTRIAEAHELGSAPGSETEVWKMRTVRSLVNVHRLNLPADMLDDWGAMMEASSSAMATITPDRATTSAWSGISEFFANWAQAIRDLPETTQWQPIAELASTTTTGPTVVRFDLLSNLVHPDGVAALVEMLDACIELCRNVLAEDEANAQFEAAARDRVTQLNDSISLDSFTASFNLFRSSTRLINDLESTVHRPRGLSMAGFRILFSLWVAGELQPRQLAALSGVSRAAVSGVLSTLSSAGLVDKTKDEADGRRYVIALTEAGRALVEENYVAQNQRERELFAPLSDEETIELGRLLRKLASRPGGYS